LDWTAPPGTLPTPWNAGFLTSPSTDLRDAAEVEEYLIDFSKKMEGHRLLTGSLPSDLNAEHILLHPGKVLP